MCSRFPSIVHITSPYAHAHAPPPASMTCDIYVSEDANNRSPQLVPQNINYGVGEEPPPFASEAECDKGTNDRSRKPHQPQTRYGDGVLMRFMGPDNPEVATYAQEHPLDWSPKQGRAQDLDRFPKDLLPPKFQSKPAARPPTTSSPMKECKEESPRSPPRTLPPPVPSQDLKSVFSPPRPRLLSLTAPPTGPPIHLAPHRRTSTTAEGLSPDSKQPDLHSRISLPSLQSLASPPNSCVGASPDTCGNTQSLPSIHSALGLSQSEFSAARINGFPPPPPYSYPPSATSRNDSPHERQLPSLLPQIPPSPLSHFSPISTKDISTNASPASQPSFWRTPTSAVSTEQQLPPPPPPPPPPSEPTRHASSMTAKSPVTSYPTPTEPVAPTTTDRTSFNSHPSPDDGSAITNIGVYKCTHSGCTAAPFQTQYLLNSHANVHSSDRPHFCPVEGCPRGVGGKGFKRKNEMMRHGLVHNSPGYVCPFCPDQQHKYPRPDNLQRHVRVHHVDKSKDDPILRGVLAQRPIGSTRGRRRRLNG